MRTHRKFIALLLLGAALSAACGDDDEDNKPGNVRFTIRRAAGDK